MTEYTTGDLVRFSLDQKPIEFEDAFKSIITDRIASAIDDKKLEMAKTIFNSPEQDTEIEQEEDTDNGEAS